MLLVAREAEVAPGPTGYRQQNILVHNCSDYSIALSRAGRLAINSAVSCYAARYSRTRKLTGRTLAFESKHGLLYIYICKSLKIHVLLLA